MRYFFLVFFIFTSCIPDRHPELPLNSKFKGDYYGFFNGDLSGQIIFSISRTGNIEGTVYYTTSNTSESILGQVMIDGEFYATARSQLNFSGYLSERSMIGRWTKGNLTGNYRFYKKNNIII